MSKKILIADDEPNIVAAIEFLLQQRGYDVHTARGRRRGARASSSASFPTSCCST